MKILKNLLMTPLLLHKLHKGVLYVLFITAFIGFVDATYLTVEHFLNKVPPCTIGGCESVLTSQYAVIMGIPVSLLGSLYYLFLVAMLLVYIDTKKDLFLRIPILMSFVGMTMSVILMFIMFFVIKAFCPYCFVSATISTIIFGISLYIIKKSKNENINN